jgi:hypothetical protein
MNAQTILRNALVSTLLLTSSYSAFAETNSPQKNIANSKISLSSNFGEIVGDFNSPDGMVVGATLPGKNVIFKIPVQKNSPQYLHFAFMHAASGQKGWYFAPKSEYGIYLMPMKIGQTKDISQEIAIFEAPNASTAKKVTQSTNNLEFAQANKFMQATVMQKNGYYIVNIKNTSSGKYETPFSSGVWATSHMKMKGFDHMPSAALSTLATSGHRDPLVKAVQSK